MAVVARPALKGRGCSLPTLSVGLTTGKPAVCLCALFPVAAKGLRASMRPELQRQHQRQSHIQRQRSLSAVWSVIANRLMCTPSDAKHIEAYPHNLRRAATKAPGAAHRPRATRPLPPIQIARLWRDRRRRRRCGETAVFLIDEGDGAYYNDAAILAVGAWVRISGRMCRASA
jgi:hypothetical protein